MQSPKILQCLKNREEIATVSDKIQLNSYHQVELHRTHQQNLSILESYWKWPSP